MKMFNKILLLICSVMLSFSVLAGGDYTFTGYIYKITEKEIVMRDDTVLKMPGYSPETRVEVIMDNQRNSLATLIAVGYVEKAAITIDSSNVVKKIVVLEMLQ